jgi:tRNA pseudouridine38-40 synthase
MPATGLARVLPRYLPDDVWLVDAREAAPTFDARRAALRRWYRYAIWRDGVPEPGWQGRCLAFEAPLDVRGMRVAAAGLVGTLDAASLVGNWGRDARPGRSTRRTVYVADWLERSDQPLLTFEVCANAFLRQMVRTLVGSLIWVGQGRWTPEQFAAALASLDRRAAGPTAPAHGLTLTRIEYRSPDDANPENL